MAAWAGHSVEILHKIYAKCLDGQDTLARRQVEAALAGVHVPCRQNLPVR
jgi:hypothetical protein